MRVGLFMNTHGVGSTRDGQWTLQPVPADDMDPLDAARRAEEVGFHALWFSDHVLVTVESESLHSAADPVTGKRAYPERPQMLDCTVMMGAVAAVTERIQLASSVLVAPYRHPLSDARQLTTVDVLSGGRLVVGVGTGWLREEFDALGVSHAARTAMTVECIEIYKRAWSDPVVAYAGEHYRFDNVSMDPKPVRRPRPPLVFGGVTPAAARITARHCDGFYPTFVDPMAAPDRYDRVLAVLAEEAEAQGRARDEITLMAVVSTRVDESTASGSFCSGSPDRIIHDLATLATRGFSEVTVHLDTRSGTVAEWREQLERFAADVLPHVGGLAVGGGWAPELGAGGMRLAPP